MRSAPSIPALQRRPGGSKGALYPLDAGGIETPLAAGANGKAIVADSTATGGLAFQTLPGSGRGVTAEFGDGLSAAPAAGMLSQGRAPYAGTITDIYVDTRDFPTQLTATCQLDVLVNGTSIFGAGSTKPFLTAGTTYHDNTFTGTVARAIAKGDRITIRLISYSGASFGLDLDLFILETP